ncbi:DJ-1/PfpI family protein [Reyranella soli]|uniref:Dimethylglycine dehydrogenase n=1 Tax=Reyranella soli TaxID=1230389 RepID=A0A512N7S4_9HYPH|nr:DJ-1/PfpI family protein [Reyranella soli]GEP55022.1 dimethylglycine dehydrogenase [Reyranella soli]
MKIGIPVYDEVDVLDVCGPFEMFDWAGFDIDLLAVEPGMKRFRSKGFPYSVSKGFADADQYDAIWVPGGEPDALAAIIYDPARTYLNFLVSQARHARMMCSVCDGAMLLAAAGLLEGYEATAHWEFLACFPQRFPKVKVAAGHPRFVHDRDRLTGGGVSSGLDTALKLIELLADRALAERVQQAMQYYPDPPVSSVIPPTPAQCPIPPAR